jgi:hypothetical protein
MVVASQVALAQDAGQGSMAQAAVSVPVRVTAAGSGPAGQVVWPGTLVGKTTWVQKLANGTTITHVTALKEASDSSGRKYNERRPEVAPGAEGEAASFASGFVYDPVSRIEITWDSRTKVALVTHWAERREARQVVAPPVAANLAQPPIARTAMPKPEIENLGMKTINGLEAKGTRTTRVIPAGKEGNDQPITLVHETWISGALGIPVITIDDDPRSATTTMELTDFEPGEPDPALFQVPEGYTIKDQFPNSQN